MPPPGRSEQRFLLFYAQVANDNFLNIQKSTSLCSYCDEKIISFFIYCAFVRWLDRRGEANLAHFHAVTQLLTPRWKKSHVREMFAGSKRFRNRCVVRRAQGVALRSRRFRHAGRHSRAALRNTGYGFSLVWICQLCGKFGPRRPAATRRSGCRRVCARFAASRGWSPHGRRRSVREAGR
jgi:hypothetical protein